MDPPNALVVHVLVVACSSSPGFAPRADAPEGSNAAGRRSTPAGNTAATSNRYDEVSEMATELQRRTFTVQEYHRLAEAGILGPDDRVELLRGQVVKKVTIGNRHRGCVNGLTRLLTLRFADRAYVQVQMPVVMLDDSEPEPDLSLLEMNEAYTGGRQAYPADVFALIEVSDASRDDDVRIKAPIYAEARIREYWVVDLIARAIMVNREPSAKRYRTTAIARPGEHIAFAAFPDELLSVDEILGPEAP
jgi:Uma2 family endonuclease